MKIKTPKKERAVVGAAAQTNKYQNESYQRAESLSNIKLLVGGLLLFGNKNQKAFWPFFEAILWQYVDLRLASQSVSEPLELKKSELFV